MMMRNMELRWEDNNNNTARYLTVPVAPKSIFLGARLAVDGWPNLVIFVASFVMTTR